MKYRFFASLSCLLSFLSLGCRPALSMKLVPAARPVSVLMLSDFHFDPFRDPAKVPALRAAPIVQWARILDDPDSQTQAEAYEKLQTACHARGVDSSWSVLKNSLEAAHAQVSSPLFVTVTGDLLTHNFDCRLQTLDPTATPEQVSAFAAQTVAFLAQQLHERFRGTPVYLAMGNNDSGCTNYHQTASSPFVTSVNASVAADFTRPHDQKTALRAFSERGDYSVLLPRSMAGTRLIVLQDVFESPAYATCGAPQAGTAPQTSQAQQAQAATQAANQVQWLRRQLLAARKAHQKVWVMAHIPPGVDAYASFHKLIAKPSSMCSGTAPITMLTSDDLASTLTDFAGTVRLALFGHTHMDELKLLHNAQGMSVAAKLVPSISPVNGNVPAFLVARVQPQTAVMLDYTVFAASDAHATSWHEEYRFSTAYHLPDVSADSVAQIASRLARDRTSSDELSQTYQRWFLAGDDGTFARGLRSIWPGYACGVLEDGGPTFQHCVCPAGPATKFGE